MAIDLNDHSTNSNTLTNSGATESADTPFVASTISVDLEYSDPDYLSAADSASLSITGDISIEAWIKMEQLPGSIGSNYFGIATKLRDDDTSSGYAFMVELNNLLRFDWFGAGGQYCIQRADAAFDGGDVGVWRHVAVTCDVSSKTAILYVDGSVRASTRITTGTNTSIGDGTARFAIGCWYTNVTTPRADTYFDGIIDEVRLWNDIRTGAEIDDNKALELAGDEAGLAAYYPFESVHGVTTTSTSTTTTTTTSTTSSTSTSTSTSSSSTSTSTSSSSSTSSSTSTSSTTTSGETTTSTSTSSTTSSSTSTSSSSTSSTTSTSSSSSSTSSSTSTTSSTSSTSTTTSTSSSTSSSSTSTSTTTEPPSIIKRRGWIVDEHPLYGSIIKDPPHGETKS